MAMSKTKLIEKILAKANNTYSEADCKEMKVAELQDLLTDLNNEEAQPDPELNEAGGIVIPEPIKPLEEPKAPKAPRGESKRDVLYAIFDETHAKGEDLKAAAKAALPETSDGVISSYLCYWRKDRNIVATRSFGNKAAGKTKAEKLKAALIKIYGEDFNIDEVTTDLLAAKVVEEA
ncbi:hypothetical protein D3C80_996180 [compost metagenome]